ncbi:MAG: hypothetical protein U0441_02560 [Polyangiaceae bacterium]
MRSRHSVFLSSIASAAVILVVAAQGCSLIAKPDRSKIPHEGGGGSGGDTTTTTVTGGGGTGGGGAGGTGGVTCTAECCAPEDCPVPDSPCVERTCEGGKCGTKPLASGAAIEAQIPGDCRSIVCDGAGATKTILDETDVPDDGLQCTVDKCVSGEPKNIPAPAGQSCTEDGGQKCDGSGVCLECLAPSDCASKVCTIAGACAPVSCADGVKNGDETDIDCGGACGASCKTGKTCSVNLDCIDKICPAMTKKCAAPACNDKVQNGTETDVDCGGSCPLKCATGAGCKVVSDCIGGICSGSTCLPSCTDGVQNNGEKAIDCGGPICASTCAVGTPCDDATDCASGFCADGVCCNSACTTACSACSAAKKTGGADGVCGPAKQGTDPHGDCDVAAPDTCGPSTGNCNGFGACEKHAAMTPCGPAPSCANGQQTNQDACDGTGSCVDAGTTPCAPYVCGASACKNSCVSDADCVGSAYCFALVCVARKPTGALCGGANQCASGFCADGVCCGSACTGACVACSVSAGGASDGACTPIPANQDPAGDCGVGSTCDGAGACKKANGQACSAPGECESGACVDSVCCDTLCDGPCQACSSVKKGSGVNGVCDNIAGGTDPDSECPGITTCDGNAACAKLPAGAACTLDGECQSGTCAGTCQP